MQTVDPDQIAPQGAVWSDLPFNLYYLDTSQVGFVPVAQPDACTTGDQEVDGLIPACSGNILSRKLILKYFLRSFSPFHWFKKGSCSVSQERMWTKPAQEKCG